MDTDSTPTNAWNASEARHRFADLLAAADKGRPQIIRHRDGREYVLVSRAAYTAAKPDLFTILTSFNFGNEDDEFDHILAELRPSIGELDISGNVGEDDADCSSTRT